MRGSAHMRSHKGPGFGHGLGFFCHDRYGSEQAKDSELTKRAEEELLLRGSCEPGLGPFGMNMPAPDQGEPHARIKEIQRVHTFVGW